MLTFELNETEDTLEIHADAQGLSELIGALRRLQQRGGHEHLMTPNWGGSELFPPKSLDTGSSKASAYPPVQPSIR